MSTSRIRKIRIATIQIVVMWISFLSANAQTISGQVISNSGNIPVPFATITTQDHQWGINATDEGEFKFDIDLLAKEDTLVVTSVGYYESRIPYRLLREGIIITLQVYTT